MNVVDFDHLGGFAGTLAALYWLSAAVVNVSFACGVWLDAGDLRRTGGRKLFLVGPGVWGLATLFGGVFIAGVYWAIHHSTLRRADGAAKPHRADVWQDRPIVDSGLGDAGTMPPGS